MLSDKQVLKQAKKRYDNAETQWSEYHQKVTRYAEFISGKQWDDQARQNFENAGFTALTSNRIPTFLRQITNELMKNPPSIQISPRSDGMDEKAEMRSDLIRNIQEECDAKIAYVKAAEHAAAYGIGYFLIRSDYTDEKTFDQHIVIEKIDDPNLIMLDPNHKGLSGEDSDFAFRTVVLTHDEYKARYSDSKLADRLNGKDEMGPKVSSWTASEKMWTKEDQVNIVEYYFKDYATKTLYQVQDNEDQKVFTTFKLDKKQIDSGVQVVLQQRDVSVPVIRICKLTDLDVLESTEWPGKYIPIIAVKADEYWVSGKRKLVGAVEPAIDAQIELNYAKSWRAMMLQMAPTVPYIGTAKQFETYEEEWRSANVNKLAMLSYNKDGDAPPPARQTFEIPIQSASILVDGAEKDLTSIFGTFDPDNAKGVVESGKAKLIRENQTYSSNYHFYENLSRSIKIAGCIILDALPVVYDTAREVMLLQADGKKKAAAINQPNEEGVVEFDMSEGDYTVSIQTGPTFGTKRQETAENIMSLIDAYPAAASAITDIMVRNMDWPGAEQIADSLEALVPPQVLAARKTDPKDAAAQLGPLKAQLAGLQQQMQQLTQENTEAKLKLQDKSDNVQIEMMKDDMEKKKMESDKEIAMRKLALEEQIAELEFMVKKRELDIAMEELAIKKQQLGVQATKAASDIAETMRKGHQEHHEHVIAMTTPDETPLTEVNDESQTGMGESLK